MSGRFWFYYIHGENDIYALARLRKRTIFIGLMKRTILRSLPQAAGCVAQVRIPSSPNRLFSHRSKSPLLQQDVQPRSEAQPLVVNEDFLEIDDLIGPKPSINNSERLGFLDFDSFSEFDLYLDSTRFAEMGSFGTQQLQLQAIYLEPSSGNGSIFKTI
ncbi:hypothetical protein L6452_14556 [Arctium lappa]|uniref:Uncharacterized protein n=1 Tax=Arctium lappa TaxID=4217 RepID=A0ACB9CLC4_ARCLA|nr:hypothetical protein L6452_14556 [Arctium lappa]